MKFLSKHLAAFLLIFFSVYGVSHAQSTGVGPTLEELHRGTISLIERVSRLDQKFESDATGRLTSVVIDGVKSEIVYGVDGKIDSVLANGRVTKIELGADSQGHPILRFFRESGAELPSTDLTRSGFPQEFTAQIAQSLQSRREVIDLREADATKQIFSFLQPGDLVANESNPKAGSVKVRPMFSGDLDATTYTPTPICIARCDYEFTRDNNECDRDASFRTALCGGGTLALAESGPGAVTFGLACIAYSANRTADCKNDAAARRFTCVGACN